MKRGWKKEAIRRISKEDWWDFGLIVTWDWNEKERDWRKRNPEVTSFGITVGMKG